MFAVPVAVNDVNNNLTEFSSSEMLQADECIAQLSKAFAHGSQSPLEVTLRLQSQQQSEWNDWSPSAADVEPDLGFLADASFICNTPQLLELTCGESELQ